MSGLRCSDNGVVHVANGCLELPRGSPTPVPTLPCTIRLMILHIHAIIAWEGMTLAHVFLLVNVKWEILCFWLFLVNDLRSQSFCDGEALANKVRCCLSQTSTYLATLSKKQLYTLPPISMQPGKKGLPRPFVRFHVLVGGYIPGPHKFRLNNGSSSQNFVFLLGFCVAQRQLEGALASHSTAPGA